MQTAALYLPYCYRFVITNTASSSSRAAVAVVVEVPCRIFVSFLKLKTLDFHHQNYFEVYTEFYPTYINTVSSTAVPGHEGVRLLFARFHDR